MKPEEQLKSIIAKIENQSLREAVIDATIEHDLENTECPASLGHHHAYSRGLLIHTIEVCEYGLAIADGPNLGQQVNKDVLIAASVCHDLCKTKEYVLRNYSKEQAVPSRHLTHARHENSKDVWVLSEYGGLIHHIQGSYACFVHHAKRHNVTEELVDAVGHAILAHHGPNRDWGSPVKPQSLEAMILHQADCLSAFYGATFHKP